MTLKADDLQVGRWYLLNQVIEDRPPSFEGMSGPMIMLRQRNQPHGCPLKIIAIDLPWLLIWNGRNVADLDSRLYLFQRASKRYVRAFIRHNDGEMLPPKSRPQPKGEALAEACGLKNVSFGTIGEAERYVSSKYSMQFDPGEEKLPLEELAKHCRPARVFCPRCGNPMVLARPVNMEGVQISICGKCGFQGELEPIE